MINYPDPRAEKFMVHDDGVDAPMPETMLGEYTSPTPDLILFDIQTD
ncbi:hypothetical protein [Spirosoma radiotolerans]|nr:hypothetical protein [Spirosoma radiotolerans]